MGRDFIVRLLKSGVKVSIAGDLWSDNGMGPFGIYAHGITETWVMEKALIGLVARESKVSPPPPPPPGRPPTYPLPLALYLEQRDRHVCSGSTTRQRTLRNGQLKR